MKLQRFITLLLSFQRKFILLYKTVKSLNSYKALGNKQITVLTQKIKMTHHFKCVIYCTSYFFLAVFAFTAALARVVFTFTVDLACFDLSTIFFLRVVVFLTGRYFNAECAAARRAIGTRNGEQDT